MAHGDAGEGKSRGNWRMEWVASTLHTTSEHGLSSFTTADAHTSAASSRLNWHLRRYKWTRSFRRKTKSGFCACAITFQTQSTNRACEMKKNICCHVGAGCCHIWIRPLMHVTSKLGTRCVESSVHRPVIRRQEYRHMKRMKAGFL